MKKLFAVIHAVVDATAGLDVRTEVRRATAEFKNDHPFVGLRGKVTMKGLLVRVIVICSLIRDFVIRFGRIGVEIRQPRFQVSKLAGLNQMKRKEMLKAH